MYIDYSFAKVITILGLSIIKAEKKDIPFGSAQSAPC